MYSNIRINVSWLHLIIISYNDLIYNVIYSIIYNVTYKCYLNHQYYVKFNKANFLRCTGPPLDTNPYQDGSLVSLADCGSKNPEINGLNRQTLTLVQSLILPVLYCTLVGADHLQNGVEELRFISIIKYVFIEVDTVY